MNFLKPPNLKSSSTIAFVSIAGNVEYTDKIANAQKYFENNGYKVKIFMPEAGCEYLGGTDEERLHCLHSAFSDASVEAIIAIRGGYGSLRLLNDVDWELIRKNPKIFVGYSDITAMLLMIYKKTGMITFHGPMICSDFGSNISHFTESHFFETVKSGFSKAQLVSAFNGEQAEGVLWGGNLTTVASLCGLDFVPDLPFVFFAEDINEPVYKIDRMFAQLANIEKFKKNLQAIVLGDFSGLDNREVFEKYVKNLAKTLNIPVFFGLKSGHDADKLTLPVGIHVKVENLTIRAF